MIRSASIQTHHSAGPSGMDTMGWQRMCTAFQGASKELCDDLATVSRQISTTYVDPSGPTAFIACRLIPLDKHPGVRPIGISETMRCIISKPILRVTKADIQSAAGSLQLCTGHNAGCEGTVHAMKCIFDDTLRESFLSTQEMHSTV